MEWRWCVLLLSCPVRWCSSCPTHPSHCSTHQYCCHVTQCSSPGVWCVGGECVSVVFVWWGILCPPSPSSWWWVGPSWMVGVCVVVVGGMVSEGRLCCWRPLLSCAWCPPFRLRGGPVEWRGVVGCVLPRVRIGVSLSHCSSFSYRSRSSSVLCCRVCCGWGSVVGDCVPFCFSLLSLCSLLQHCWFSVVSLCEGCVIVE